MKNITLTVDDLTYRRARVTAAERGLSVSALVRGYLREVARPEASDAEQTGRLFAALDPVRSYRASRRLSREKAHARGRLS